MRGLLRNIRFYILLSSFLISLLVFLVITSTIGENRLRIIRLEQVYGILGISFLYFAVLATPLTKVFDALPHKDRYLKARRGLGVSAFYFSALHVAITFFGQLGGFGGLQFLTGKYLFSLALGVLALMILMLMTLTSTDWAIRVMTIRWWKFLHRFVYVASVAVLLHVFLISSHFNGLADFGTQILLVMLIILALLESIRIDNRLQLLRPRLRKIGPATTTAATLALVVVGFSLLAGLTAPSEQIANNDTDVTKDTSIHTNVEDSRPYTVSFNAQALQANQPSQLAFSIFDGTSGLPIAPFASAISKFKVIIVSDTLDYYAEVPLTRDSGTVPFVASTTFPREGYYIFYVRFFDSGKLNTVTLSTQVGNDATAPADRLVAAERTIGLTQISASLQNTSGLNSTELSLGTAPVNDTIIFKRILLVNTSSYEFELFDDLSASSSTTVQTQKKLLGTYRIFATLEQSGVTETLQYTVEAE